MKFYINGYYTLFWRNWGIVSVSLWWLNNTKYNFYQCLSINQICVSLLLLFLVVVVPLLALLCTTVMYLCQMTWLLLRLPILNARTSPTQTAATLKTVTCFVLYAVCQWQTFTKMHEDAAFSLFDCDPYIQMGQEYSREIIVCPYWVDCIASAVSVKCQPICNFWGETKDPVGAFPFTHRSIT